MWGRSDCCRVKQKQKQKQSKRSRSTKKKEGAVNGGSEEGVMDGVKNGATQRGSVGKGQITHL